MPIPEPPAPDGAEVELSIVMPCLNEAATLATCIGKARRFLDDRGISGEIVIGDNGSTDGSREIARGLGARVVEVPIRGYGAAIDRASRSAKGRYIIMGDSDDSYDFLALMPFLERLRGGSDLVMGNRFLGGIRPAAMPWKNRYIGNPALSSIGRLFFRCPARDFHCGLRGYSAAAYREMDLITTGMEFASEMVIKATLLHLEIAEVPTSLHPDGRDRPPHLRPWRDGWRHLRFMALYSPKWLFFYPGAALMLGGSVGLLALVPGPRRVGGVTLDVHTLLYAAAAVLLGFQGVAFTILAKAFAVTQGLLPSGTLVRRTVGIVGTESGLVAGLALVLAGLVGSVAAFAGWGAGSFGALDPSKGLRLVIPSVLALALGGQTLLASFFLDVMRLHLRPRSTPAEAREAPAAAIS